MIASAFFCTSSIGNVIVYILSKSSARSGTPVHCVVYKTKSNVFSWKWGQVFWNFTAWNPYNFHGLPLPLSFQFLKKTINWARGGFHWVMRSSQQVARAHWSNCVFVCFKYYIFILFGNKRKHLCLLLSVSLPKSVSCSSIKTLWKFSSMREKTLLTKMHTDYILSSAFLSKRFLPNSAFHKSYILLQYT